MHGGEIDHTVRTDNNPHSPSPAQSVFVGLVDYRHTRMGPLNGSTDAVTEGRAEGVVVAQQKQPPPGQRHMEDQRETAGAAIVHMRSAPQRPPTAPPSAVEWKDLVTTLRTLHLGRQQAQACGAAPRRPRPKVCTTREGHPEQAVLSEQERSFSNNSCCCCRCVWCVCS